MNSLKRMGIDTYQETVVYMRADCYVCRSEGFEAHTRVQVSLGKKSVIATLNVVHDTEVSNILRPLAPSVAPKREVAVNEIYWTLMDSNHKKKGHFLAFLESLWMSLNFRGGGSSVNQLSD